MRDLTEWTRSVRERLDPCHASTVCDFDPMGGGVNARVMYLAQDPSSTAASTGFISPDNNDATAKATTEACLAAGLSDQDRIHWNVYPWWVNAPCVSPVKSPDALAEVFLTELLDLLPQIVAVVLIGNPAKESWVRLTHRHHVRRQIRTWSGPHPSYGWWAKPYKPGIDGRLGREVVVSALTEARLWALATNSLPHDTPTRPS